MKYVYIAILLTILVTACTVTPPTPSTGGTYTEPVTIINDEPLAEDSFSSDADYQAFVQEQSGTQGYYGGFGMDVRMMDSVDMAMAESAPSSGAVLKDSIGSVDYSETNVQVQGVDEADIIKTDGEYIYTITGMDFFIVKAGEDAEIVYSETLDHRPTSMFIEDDRLVLFGYFNDNDYYERIGIRPMSGMTYFDVYDISDHTSPEVIEELRFEGRYMDGRMMNGMVYLALQVYPEVRDVYPTPIFARDGEVARIPARDIYYFPMPYNYPQLVSLHSIDISDGEIADSVAVTMDNYQTLYMSENNIFLVGSQYINEWDIQRKITQDLIEPKLTTPDKELIEKIKATDNDVLSQGEKENKIYQVYTRYMSALSSDEQEDLNDEMENLLMKEMEKIQYFEYTVIERVSVNGGDIDVKANGKVPGQISSQFSLDEKDDNLRIATTINPRWNRWADEDNKRQVSTNNVWILDSELKTVGSLTGLAEDERIFSTRFAGDRLYMVTYRQVDPFFVIDLSNPKNPELLGELKITGFSRYLHPYDENHIIGLGHEATESGRTTGLKVSLFDVSDVENPKEVAKFVTDERYAQTGAEYEHKAFLFDKERELLVIPAYNREYNWCRWEEDCGNKEEGYNGAFVFRINEDEITLRGLIDHSMATDNYWSPSVERSLYIDDLLYTKSPTLLRINNLEDLEGVKDVELEVEGSGKIPIY